MSRAKLRADADRLIFFAERWHGPIFASSGSRVWRVRDWRSIDNGREEEFAFTWGYHGDGCYSTAYAMVREAFGKDAVLSYAGRVADEIISAAAQDEPIIVRGADLCRMLNPKSSAKKE